MHAFSFEHVLLGNQLGHSSLGRLILSPCSHHIGMGPHEISVTDIGMSTDVVIVPVLFRQPWRFHVCGFLSQIEDAIFQKTSH